jgi:ATP-dependent Clp protease ATP-binding subunit ClpA
MSDSSIEVNHQLVVAPIQRAYNIAQRLRHEIVTTEHVLRSLLEEDDIIDILDDLGIDIDGMRDVLDEYLNSGVIPTRVIKNIPGQTPALERVKHRTVVQCLSSGRDTLRCKDILVAILTEDDCHSTTICAAFGLDHFRLIQYLADSSLSAVPTDTVNSEYGRLPSPTQKPAAESKTDQILKALCINLNDLAKAGKIDPLVGRENEIATVISILARRRKNSALLLGEAGVGKTAILEGIAKKIVNGDVPDTIKDAVLYQLDLPSLIAGAKFRGEFEERLKLVINALLTKPHAVLVIDNIHMTSVSGGEGGPSIANILAPYLNRGEIQTIGSTTYQDDRKYFQKDRTFNRCFHRVDVFEPSSTDAVQILQGLKDHYEGYHGVVYQNEALQAAVDLTVRYVHGRFLPDKAIDVMDAAGAAERVKPPTKRKKIIGVFEIEQQVARIAKIPPKSVKDDDIKRLSRLEKDLKGVVFGQDRAIDTLIDAVYQSRAGLRDKRKPLGCYLFAGPTGVGKTETAVQLAATLGIELVRLNMSEYQEKHAAATLIGGRPGYVGYEDGNAGSGVLINMIEKTPHCVLLLDEIEKAHPDIYDLFLQVMDTGKLTSGSGKEVDFRNVYLIMTSNAGATELQKNSIGFTASDDRSGAEDKVINERFKPEFRNRLDAIVKYRALTEPDMLKVVTKFINELNDLSQENRVKVVVNMPAKRWLAREGYDPKMGARPLARVIQQYVKKPLSREMLFGKLVKGGTVVIGVSNNELEFKYDV